MNKNESISVNSSKDKSTIEKIKYQDKVALEDVQNSKNNVNSEETTLEQEVGQVIDKLKVIEPKLWSKVKYNNQRIEKLKDTTENKIQKIQDLNSQIITLYMDKNIKKLKGVLNNAKEFIDENISVTTEQPMKINEWVLNHSDLSQKELFNKLNKDLELNYSYTNFNKKMVNNNLSAKELIGIARILDLDLNDLK